MSGVATTTGRVEVNGLKFVYEAFGARSEPPVVLISGLGSQMLGWDARLCALLAGHGHYVVRFDNRDVGLSTHLRDAPVADPVAVLGGDHSSVAYTLEDMADDVAGLLDGLGLASAHIAGMSMGGMVAQAVAIRHPQRVRSLVSVMSTTGAPEVGGATVKASQLLGLPPVRNGDEYVERAVTSARVLGSPDYPFDEEELRSKARAVFDRAYDPAGAARQLIAILASPDRTEALRSVRVPALVIHGREDPLIQVSGGEATAAALPDAELMVLDGVGHDLPPALWSEIVDRVCALVRRAERHARDASARQLEPATEPPGDGVA